MPFSSHMEADNARYFLDRRTQLQGPIRKELGVNGRMLVLSVLKGAGDGEGVVGCGQGQPRPRRSHNGGLSLKEYGALGLSV